MSCFICDLVASETHKIVDTRTSYRGIALDNVLYDFISKYFDVEIDDGDIVCDTCAALLDAMDRFRCELDNVESMLQLQITRKYKLNEVQLCRLDDRTARRFRKGTYQRFACVECSFETDFVDCLIPHSWRHEHLADFIKTSPVVVDRSPTISRGICRSCNLAFDTDELLELHLLEFHADVVDLDPVNDDASPIQLEIDAEGENDGEDEIAACNDDLPQCEVS